MPTESSAVLSSPTARYRLRSGYHLLPSDGDWLLYRPDGKFARLRIRPELSEAASFVLAAESRPSHGDVDEDELEKLLEQLVLQGVAEVVADEPVERTVTRVTICGEGETARLLTEILTAGGLDARPRAEGPEHADLPTDVWVDCAGWLPDARFQERDRWCFENGVAWHGVYAEGDRFHLGPFWLPEDPSTVRYGDARLRRLAAEVHPDGLEDYWRHLEEGVRVNPLDPPNAAEAALVAGALAADILARSKGSKPPSHGHQLAYARPTGRWRRHPVLPVPRGLMTERMP